MKRIERDGKFYRIRRGREVEIPAQWVGETPHGQTKQKRQSKRPRKQRFSDRVVIGRPGHPIGRAPRHSRLARDAEKRE